ncbi:SDR family oxidoreductase [uncultured Ornithinimicrobium sp.]|jgi:NAD(P)-dependent dehydrogenase (short-subunit alcohol dehydrogenase family)|uniref:SDR family NAD(P)-dependent oxidoreductase n=1 Tax=uncultured Ornithinimicrobium sp. TaxID=259307 RepID=UPI002593A82B|nr:SDR family NAD(P)-dependent oxidoreductase [uncultured Ornithinimicrobium sp.]
MQVNDKVFVVTGGGNGIGREVVLELIRRGARVAALDLRAEALAGTQGLAAAGERLSVHVVDIGDRERVEAVADEVVAVHGRVDGLLNVAGIIQQFVPFAELDYPEMEKVLQVNLWGTIHVNKAFLPHLRTAPEACLVNVSSMGGFLPVPGQTLYGASKAAVTLLTEGLYAELRETDVAVTVVFPGAIGTDITANSGVAVPGGADAAEARANSQHRVTSAVDAARTIVDQAVVEGRFRVTVGKDAMVMDLFSRVAPRRATDFIARKMADLLQRPAVPAG